MMPLLEMALSAIADPVMLPVLGDFIQELGWYDERVVTVCLMPLEKARWRLSPGKRRKRAVLKSRTVLEGPNIFARLTAAPTPALARAVAAVLLFGDWPVRPFGTLYRVWKDRYAYERERRQREHARHGGIETVSTRNDARVIMRPVSKP